MDPNKEIADKLSLAVVAFSETPGATHDGVLDALLENTDSTYSQAAQQLANVLRSFAMAKG